MAITRREFLQSSISLALVSLNGYAGASGNIHTEYGEVLPDVIYRLFPHSRLSKDVYEQVTERLSSRIGQSEELTAIDPCEWFLFSTSSNMMVKKTNRFIVPASDDMRSCMAINSCRGEFGNSWISARAI